MCIVDSKDITVICVFASSYRQRLLCMFILLLGDIQPVNKALQLLPEGFHLGIDAIQQLMFSDPVEKRSFQCSISDHLKYWSYREEI